jgi:hypothetical protein
MGSQGHVQEYNVSCGQRVWVDSLTRSTAGGWRLLGKYEWAQCGRARNFVSPRLLYQSFELLATVATSLCSAAVFESVNLSPLALNPGAVAIFVTHY